MGEYIPGVLGNWSAHRDFPEFAPKSFRQLWKERAPSPAGGSRRDPETGEGIS